MSQCIEEINQITKERFRNFNKVMKKNRSDINIQETHLVKYELSYDYNLSIYNYIQVACYGVRQSKLKFHIRDFTIWKMILIQ